MKHGRIIVEGLTDCYFVHQLILSRFGEKFLPIYDDERKKGFRYPTDKDAPDEVFRFVRKDHPDVTLEILETGGANKEDVLRGLLRDESGESRDFYCCVIFDADFLKSEKRDATGNGGIVKAKQTFIPIVGEDSLFFFPDNKTDGTIETLLKNISTADKKDYFDECWPAFTKALDAAQPKVKRNLSLKTELSNYVEAYGKKIGERKCQIQNLKNEDLWAYNSFNLASLVGFLAKFFSKLDEKKDY